MKRLVLILLLVIFQIVLSSCNQPSAIADSGMDPSMAQSSGPVDGASAELQPGAVSGLSPASSDAPPAPDAADPPAQEPVSFQSSGSLTAGSSTSSPAAPNLPNPTHEIVIPAPVPAYTTAENILNNTLSGTYHGEQLISIHALDVKNYLTVRYTLLASMASFDERDFAALLEAADTTPKAADRAFMLFTDKGRHYIYLDQNTPPELNAVWETIYNGAPKNIHWLAHMTTGKIVKISFGGWSQDADTDIGLTVEDSETIGEISNFLKNYLTVNTDKPVELFDGAMNPSMPAGLYMLHIDFDNDVRYGLMGYGDYGGTDAGGSHISIYTSDLGKTVSYTLSEGAAGQLRDFMEEKQIAFWEKNGSPTRTNVKILSATPATEKLTYSKDLKVPLRIENGSTKAITVITDFVTRRHPLGGEAMEYMPWGEGYPGSASRRIPAGGHAVISVPFSAFDLSGDGRGKYQTEFWVDGKFKIFGSYVVE